MSGWINKELSCGVLRLFSVVSPATETPGGGGGNKVTIYAHILDRKLLKS